MRIAVVGTGIAGMVSAYLLAEDHDVTVYEANDYAGGHTHTVDVADSAGTAGVDTGFIVYNERTYPNFIKLLSRLRVPTQPSDMSFGVRCEETDLEYAVTSLNAVFAQRGNLLRPAFYRMLLDVLRYLRHARRFLRRGYGTESVEEFLGAHRYSPMFREKFLLPMLAAIWSSEPDRAREFPARHFLQFFENHGLLNLFDQPVWRVITGGSREYARRLTASYADRIRLSTPVVSVRRTDSSVVLKARGQEEAVFDHVILATHSDQTLALLADPTNREREVLSAFPYRANDTVLHTDTGLLPRNRRAWSSWNYHCTADAQAAPMVTYNMNRLQSLATQETYCVTLNRRDAVATDRLIDSFEYHHPVFTAESLRAQQRHGEISGVGRTHFCGAYWGYGFHEDGVKSALAVCRYFGKHLD